MAGYPPEAVHLRCSIKRGVLKISPKIHRKTPASPQKERTPF